MSLRDLHARIGAVNDVLCALSLLVWDSRTMMPAGGTSTRGAQIATLTRLARELLLAAETRRALDGALREVEERDAEDPDRRAVEQTRLAVAFHERIPADLIERRAAQRAEANAAWIAAREKSEFSIFQPFLKDTLDLTREYAHAAGFDAHPYDAMVAIYEPGETYSSLQALFSELRTGLRSILDTALGRPAPRTDFLRRDFPEERQRELARSVAETFGYDFDRGRLDTTVHPFEISFTRGDVRITTRYRRNFLPPALFGAMHETGHGLYEQNVDPAFTRTALATDLIGLYAVGGTSFGAHESQSRLWENHVGRSLPFWRLNFRALQAAFPDALADVDADSFHAAVNVPAPSLIRTEADELTYDFHIMLRVDIEAALMNGDLAVADIPGAWNERMKAELGLKVPSDREGCLQDIHWSSGMIGSFPTYTIGNVMAAQLFAAARVQESDLDSSLEAGDYSVLRNWLTENVCRHGRRFGRQEILQKATGRPLWAGPYLAYLAKKHGAATPVSASD
jgi:carboxypeptidase Taq